MTEIKNQIAEIYWDQSDPQCIGWAWRQGDESGALDSVPQEITIDDDQLRNAFRTEIGPATEIEVFRVI